MKVTQWLPGFLMRHRSRHPRADWPADDDDRFRRAWLDALLGMSPKPRESEADAASLTLNSEGLAWPEDHPPAVVRAITAARERPKGPTTGDADEAKRLSVDCPWCGGSGHATVYHPAYDGNPIGELVLKTGVIRCLPMRIAAHCVCPLGRSIRSRTDQALSRQIPDMVRVLDGESAWQAEDPTAVELPAVAPRDWRRAVEALAERMHVP